MKLRNIFIAGMSAVALAGCSDYLEVEAPSKNLPTDVFSDARAMERARNGVYASMLSSNLFGDKLLNTFVRNSDVDFATNTSQYSTSNKYCRFDCDPSGGDIKSLWSDLYHGIEVCNLFIEGAEGSPAYDAEDPDPEIIQMLGEAKVARAMFYYELIWNFGDVPFSFKSSRTSETMVYPVTDRIAILDKCIKDIEEVADDMKDPSALSEGIERISRQAAYAMIARLAMTAGGWYLAPDGETYGKWAQSPEWRSYYETARKYAQKVVDSKQHSLTKEYYKVFVDECNNVVTSNDDPMFEIPFGKESTGNIGYIHGPKMDMYEGITPHPYGKASSGAKLHGLYRFMFDDDDARRDYVNQLFRYTADGGEFGTRMDNGYVVQNGKWSKLWVRGGLGRATEGNTGINFPYIRYADVLLTLAEADCVLEGQATDLAKECLKTVRQRAFGMTNDQKIEDFATDPEGFLKAVLDERKFEFAGESMRWRDLIRNKKYAEELYWTFFRYVAFAQESGGSSEYLDMVAAHDFDDENGYANVPFQVTTMRTCDNRIPYDDPNHPLERILSERQFPNQDVQICWVYEPYRKLSTTDRNAFKGQFKKTSSSAWTDEDLFQWWDDDSGSPKSEVRYSLLGFIQMDPSGTYRINNNGTYNIAPDPSVKPTSEDLPVVRYILPYPASEIARSQGKYVNKYGYSQQ